MYIIWKSELFWVDVGILAWSQAEMVKKMETNFFNCLDVLDHMRAQFEDEDAAPRSHQPAAASAEEAG